MPGTRDNTHKRKSGSSRRQAGRSMLLLFVCLGTIVYIAGCVVVLSNSRSIDKLGHEPVSMEMALRAERYSMLHDSEFFRLLAEKLPYYPHDPEVVLQLYRLALRKAPSSHSSFFSYAYYTGARNCCRDQLLYLLQETVRRCPTHPRMQRIAATYFLALNNREQAMFFIRRALQLQPSSAPEMYRMLEQGGVSIAGMISATPDTADSLIQLSIYLAGTNSSDPDVRKQTLEKLNGKDLSPEQHLQVAGLAWKAGLRDVAQRQAQLAASAENTRAEAFAFKAQMLWESGNHAEALRIADSAEQAYRQENSVEAAARYAMSIASLQRSQNETAEAKTRMLRILNDYPNYAPAYFQMAQFTRGDSAELELFYLKKTRDLAPDNVEYRKVYAERLLELNHIPDAEAAFSDLLSTADTQREAFLGLARCRIASGDKPGALVILQQAVQRSVTSYQIYFQLGQLYASLGEYEKAATAYLEYSKMASGTVDGINLAGDAYLNMGRYPAARDLYRKALEKEPGNRHAEEALTQLKMLGIQ